MTEEVTDEIREKAKVIAEATGRSEQAIIDDLMDDGIVNLSNEEKKDASLVEQLKEAAELIATVQSINKQVSDNTVLNGGNNKTEVAVETTLEGDIIDRAIESAQRKADNFKKLILTLAPIFLLLTGGAGLEVLGVTDIVGSDENNYNPNYDCYAAWMYNDHSYLTDNNIYVDTTFYDDNYCNIELEGHFIVSLLVDGAVSNQQTINTGYFRDYYDLSAEWLSLASGTYQIAVEFHTVECDDGTCEHGPEWNSPYRPSFTIDNGDETSDCVPDWWWKDEAIFDHDHNGQGYNNDLRVQVTFRDLNSCNIHMNNGYFEIMVGDDDRILEYNFHNEFTINEHYLDLAPGDYYVTVDYYTYNGSHWSGPTAWVTMESEPEPVRGCTDSSATNYDDKATEDDGSCEYPPEECDNPYLYSIQGFTTSDTFSVSYDPDCPSDSEKDIIVTLSARPHGTDTTLKSVTDSKTIVGNQYDDWSIAVSDFVESPYTHYDFTWVMAWQDSNGDYQVDFTNWSNIEYDLPEEPTPCENLTITSESLTLYAYGDDLGIAWNLTHDGPRTSDCYFEVEIFITLYQNGTYYNVSEYHQNPTFIVFNNYEGNQTMIFGPDEIALFKDLPDGEYEILAKYRIKGTSDASGDHFANKVTISTT